LPRHQDPFSSLPILNAPSAADTSPTPLPSRSVPHVSSPHSTSLPSSTSPILNAPSLADLATVPAGIAQYKKHFTATAVVIEQSHILLVHHRRIGAWLPPGGHIEEHELPHETAIRETKEETGVDIATVAEELPLTGKENAFFLPTPICIHAVKANENNSVYYHVDLAYLIYDARWIKLDCLLDLPLAHNVLEIVALAKSRLNLQ
jgi:8-oxo-dGTP pyrophosphatase MutT (NUDIX family)